MLGELKIECPFCVKKIPARAKKCPNCLEWLDGEKKEESINKIREELKIKKISNESVNKAFGNSLGLLILLLVFGFEFENIIVFCFLVFIILLIIFNQKAMKNIKKPDTINIRKKNLREFNFRDKSYFLNDITKEEALSLYKNGDTFFIGEDLLLPKFKEMVSISSKTSYGKSFEEIISTIQQNRFKDKNINFYGSLNKIDKIKKTFTLVLLLIFILFFGTISITAIFAIVYDSIKRDEVSSNVVVNNKVNLQKVSPPIKIIPKTSNIKPVIQEQKRNIEEKVEDVAKGLTILDIGHIGNKMSLNQEMYYLKIQIALDKCKGFKNNPTEIEIADKTVKARELLQKKGINRTLLSLLEAGANEQNKSYISYDEFMALLVTLG